MPQAIPTTPGNWRQYALQVEQMLATQSTASTLQQMQPPTCTGNALV